MIPFAEVSHAITDAIATLECHGHTESAALLRIHGPALLRIARHAAGHPDRTDEEPHPVSAEAETVAIENPSRVHG
jgi:hypothetical protein